MRALDRVIGYESIKVELYRIIDIFHNPEKYKALGVSVPKGFILDGEPGIGKTLMAKAFIEESGRKNYVIRKDRPDGAFVDHIRETFDILVNIYERKILIKFLSMLMMTEKNKILIRIKCD